MAFKIFCKNCCGLDIHKTWIYACIGITDANGRTEYKQARFSSFSNGLRELAGWLTKHSCADVCMESTGKYWIPVFNIFEKTCWVTLAHPKYTKPQKGNKTDRKDAKWICDLYMCGMGQQGVRLHHQRAELESLCQHRGLAQPPPCKTASTLMCIWTVSTSSETGAVRTKMCPFWWR